MTVKELIEELHTFPSDLEVLINIKAANVEGYGPGDITWIGLVSTLHWKTRSY